MPSIATSHEGGRITIDPDICNGRPVIRGMRITVETVLGYLSAGDTAEEIGSPTFQVGSLRSSLPAIM
jgi:uncharacterized protein (DUF433 family)